MGDSPMDGEADGRSLRARLETAGRLLGVSITVSEGEEWSVRGGEVQVGLGFFAARGHPVKETVALALLELWGTVREARNAPVRVRRRNALARLRPELEPLLASIDRMQAAWALMVALPALRDDIAAATSRSIPEEVREWPRHLQWVSLLLVQALAPHRELCVGDDAKREAFAALGRSSGVTEAEGASAGSVLASQALRLVLTPESDRDSLQMFERALALTLPSYLRLLEQDLATVGPRAMGLDTGAGPEEAEALPQETGLGDDAETGAEETGEAEDEDDAGSDAEQDLADLVPSVQKAFVARVLATPLPSDDAVIEAMLQEAVEPPESKDPERGPGGSGREAVTLADYCDRASLLEDAITRMREVWRRVIAERVALKPMLTRRAFPEGEELQPDALARVVAEVRAGRSRPDAFRRRSSHPRPADRSGSTDYVLAVDRSGSMWGRAALAAADAALVMLEGLAGAQRDIEHAEREAGVSLELGIRAALIVFDAEAALVTPLAGVLGDGARRRLHAEIRSPGGGTNDAAALRLAAEQLGVVRDRGVRSGGRRRGRGDGLARRRIVILVSDGGSNDPVAADAELRRLRGAGVEVYGIGVGTEEIVRRFAPTSVVVDDPAQLPQVLQRLVEREVAQLSRA